MVFWDIMLCRVVSGSRRLKVDTICRNVGNYSFNYRLSYTNVKNTHKHRCYDLKHRQVIYSYGIQDSQ
jgi:hypothetical protein